MAHPNGNRLLVHTRDNIIRLLDLRMSVSPTSIAVIAQLHHVKSLHQYCHLCDSETVIVYM